MLRSKATCTRNRNPSAAHVELKDPTKYGAWTHGERAQAALPPQWTVHQPAVNAEGALAVCWPSEEGDDRKAVEAWLSARGSALLARLDGFIPRASRQPPTGDPSRQ